ncbi:hypothetical protein J2S17_005406 [Cytobacillus purgationiresistens]|uniref:Initiator Rep protein WH1 domain-containing protein n=1 Tax=Cytobacillus purgationiresistens TaxID=863449 RepID=A0ABU0AQC3_9BACI|nr:replication initiation protein [Cytobacillus purgationiresistens]MDQ0273474.1 hypothetical protein [Cytobacillus purgationiresistens]
MLETELVEPSGHKLVTKSNMLIEANYKLGVIEQKIILCLASNIHPSDSDFKTYTLPIKEFTKLLGLKGSPKYSDLRQTTKELMQKVFEVRIDKKVIQVAWLSYVAYNETEGTIDIRFDPFLRPYLLELKREFTSYKLENVVKLKSSYAIRIYELLKQYEKIQERTFSLGELRKMLGAEDIYPAYGNFKQRVLIPAQRELKKQTDISFMIEEIKSGRRVTKVKFIIQAVKNKPKQLSLFEDNLEEFRKHNSHSVSIKKMGLMMGVRITDEVIDSWEKFGFENIVQVMEQIQHRTDIENPIGYITKVLGTVSISQKQAASSLEEDPVLPFLMSYFRKSKEVMPDWFINDKAIEEIQAEFDVDSGEAKEMFDGVKEELYEMLGVAAQQKEDTSLDHQHKVEEMKKMLDQLRQRN